MMIWKISERENGESGLQRGRNGTIQEIQGI
jgi:hypothetical protein